MTDTARILFEIVVSTEYVEGLEGELSHHLCLADTHVADPRMWQLQ